MERGRKLAAQSGVDIMRSVSQLLNPITERYWEWRLDIQTQGNPTRGQPGLRDDAIPYCPVPFRAFFRAMKHVPRDLISGTFVDYGAGEGRALVLAARFYRFQRVVGVELSPELCEKARRNLDRATALRGEVICCDAASYQPPEDTTVFFLYNPFFGETMDAVVRNLHASLRKNPRRAAIVVCRARNFLAATAGQDWLVERAAGEMLGSFNWRVFMTRDGC